MSIDHISPFDFHFVSSHLRDFFKSKGLIEVPTHRLSILASCEDPQNLGFFDYTGQTWPLAQTNQMWLEYEILKYPNVSGYFSCANSYRNESNPIPGRHQLIFPMFEFEIHGGMEELISFEKEMLIHLGYDKSKFVEVEYKDIAKKYGVEEIKHEHEQRLYKEYGPTVFLKNFPEETSPFWNMKRDEKTGLAQKVDVILSGSETVGSAVRSRDKEDMRKRFYTISNGEYAKLLFDKFGKGRVEQELNDYLSLEPIERVGAGIGVTRVISSLKKEKLM